MRDKIVHKITGFGSMKGMVYDSINYGILAIFAFEVMCEKRYDLKDEVDTLTTICLN